MISRDGYELILGSSIDRHKEEERDDYYETKCRKCGEPITLKL